MSEESVTRGRGLEERPSRGWESALSPMTDRVAFSDAVAARLARELANALLPAPSST